MDKFVAIAALCLSLLGFLYTAFRDRFGDKRRQSQDFQDKIVAAARLEAESVIGPLEVKFGALSDKIIRIETQIEFYWSNTAKKAARALHSPHTPNLDRLIEKFDRDQLNAEEMMIFVRMLQEIEDDPTETTGKRHAASTVLLSIRHRFAAIIKEPSIAN